MLWALASTKEEVKANATVVKADNDNCMMLLSANWCTRKESNIYKMFFFLKKEREIGAKKEKIQGGREDKRLWIRQVWNETEKSKFERQILGFVHATSHTYLLVFVWLLLLFD